MMASRRKMVPALTQFIEVDNQKALVWATHSRNQVFPDVRIRGKAHRSSLTLRAGERRR